MNNDINEALRSILDDLQAAKRSKNPTPAQINRIIAAKHREQKRLRKLAKKAAKA